MININKIPLGKLLGVTEKDIELAISNPPIDGTEIIRGKNNELIVRLVK